MTPRALRMWLGNYDGRRRGLIITKSKSAAARIAGCSLKEFNEYWTEPRRVVEVNGFQDFEPDTLYTSRMDARVPTFFKGRCAL